jgi:hypothetical protein
MKFRKENGAVCEGKVRSEFGKVWEEGREMIGRDRGSEKGSSG